MDTPEVPVSSQRDAVLAVDDNDQNLQLLEAYLSTWGYDVVVAHDGREALELYPRVNPSVIILDVMMPVMDGYEACTCIKGEPAGRTIPILMLTALTGTEDKIKALECGADDFLNKPINKDELRSRIRSLIRIGNLRRELDSSENIILTLTNALGNKDEHSAGHVQRVAAYASLLADKLGLSSREREMIVKGALLHDVGKIGVPESLLNKAAMTPEEVQLVGRHTTIGASILEPMKTFREFVPMVRSHHERFDGGGYPDGLKGNAIPLEAQIVGLTDRYDEVVHEDGLDEPDALALLAQEAEGGAFDTPLIPLFAAALSGEPPSPATSRHLSIRPPSPARVLCIDDNAANGELVAASVRDAGFHMSFAANAEEAVDVIDRGGIDVVLLDLLTPVQDGGETLRLLRKDPRHEFLPVIVLTAQRGGDMRQDAIVAGADDFIVYPLNRLELITRIRSLLRIKDYHADLEQTHNVICALALALEAKDQYTRGHSQRVGDLARKFALHLGLDDETSDRIRVAGLLHDIGKIAVPESLLNKQGPLTREEFLRVIDHPTIGEEMVRPLMTLNGMLPIIRHHHERYDGRGYPDGIRGEAIPYEVRLLSIVDAYDALTSHRSYRPAPLTHTAALETLRREASGGKWDPALVEQFTAMLGTDSPEWEAITQKVPSLYSL